MVGFWINCLENSSTGQASDKEDKDDFKKLAGVAFRVSVVSTGHLKILT